MSDLITRTLNRIDEHHNLELPLDGDLTLPFYDGLSLANLPGTVTQLLGAPSFGRPALDESMLESLGGPYKKVVFFWWMPWDIHCSRILWQTSLAWFGMN